MKWRTPAGVGAVMLVLGLCVGVLASVATTNDLLTGSISAVPALLTLAVAVLALAVAVAFARPSRDWLSNPYW